MKKPYAVLLIFLVALELQSSLIANDYIINRRHLTENDGLSHNQVFSFHQDHYGFMWIGTKYGLNRYDGNEFLWFTREQNGLQSNYISKIFQGEGDWLWLVHAEEKHGTEIFFSIDLIHSVTFEIKHLGSEPNDILPFKISDIHKLICMPDGRLIFALKNSDHFIYSANDHITRLPFNEGMDILLATADDAVWGATDNTLLRLSLDGKIIQSLPLKEGETASSMFMDNTERIWLVTGEAYKNYKGFRVNARIYVVADDILIPMLDDAGLDNTTEISIVSLVKNQSTLIFHDEEVFEIDKNLEVSYHNPTILAGNPFRLNRCLTADHNDLVWYGHRDGFWMFDFQPARFDQYLKNKNNEPYPVRGMAEYGRYLFVNSIIDGSYLDLETDKVYSYIEGHPQFEFNKCFPMVLTKKGELWTANDRLNQLDSNGEIINVINLPVEGRNRIWSFFQDYNNTWWMGAATEHIYFYNSSLHQEPQLFGKYNGFGMLKTAEIWQFVEDERGIWMAAQNGLYLMDQEKGILARYSMQEQGGSYLPANQFHYVFKADDGNYWLATGDAGLLKIAVDSAGNVQILKHLTRATGLPSNELYAIFKDDFGFFWISSANGLIRYDQKSGALDIFYEEQGITHNEFNRLSYFQSPSGRMYFGGLNGITAFDPAVFTETKSYDVPLTWSGVNIFSGTSDSLNDITMSVLKDGEIVYRPGDKFITISLSLQDYFYSNRVRYSYKIEGLHDEWTDIGSNVLQLSGLPYGKYILRVKARGFGNRLSINQPSLQIHVLKPFYLQWWFILLFVALLLVSFWQYYLWRVQDFKKLQQRLENKVVERTKKIMQDKEVIEQQATQLRELNEMKSRFFANISHELRTPLTLIMGPLENVLRRNQQENKDRKLLNLIQQNSRLLLKRINEFLDLSKLDAAKVKVENEPVQVYGFLKNVISEFENGAGIKNIPVNFASGLNAETIVLADGDKLEKIVSNFLSNAVKFTPANGAINIGLEKVDNMLQISVADTGPGIPAHEIQKIFDRFYKSPHHHQAGGTGIGLAMCREFAQLMKGKVWAESELGEGSIFYLQIPYEEMAGNISETTETPEENQIPKGELFATSNKGETILVVEDNPDLQEYLKVVLENFRVLTAGNGEAALEALAKNPAISLIISDIMMPVMDGLTLLKKLKQSDAFCHIPVIMLTARQNMETRIEALRIGVDDYVVKPFREAELNARVANLLAHRNSREEVSPGNDQDLKEDVPPQTLSPDDVKWLASVEKIVLENVEDSQFNISQLADEMDLGIRRFQQKIKAITGLTPKEYQREIQLEQARRLLESGDYQTMTEVSYRVGFKDAHYFSGLYYKRFGKKPSEYL